MRKELALLSVGVALLATVFSPQFRVSRVPPAMASLAALAYLLYLNKGLLGMMYYGTLAKLAAKRAMEKRITAADVWDSKVLSRSAHPFVLFEKAQYTYGQIDEWANKFAQWGVEAGLKAGDTVALMMENRPEFVAAWIGMAKIGVTSSLINTNLKEKSLAHCISESKVNAILVGSECAPACCQIKPSVPVWVYRGPHGQEKEGEGLSDVVVKSVDEYFETHPLSSTSADFKAFRKEVLPKENLFYIFTSGTTGLPKAARMNHLRFIGASHFGDFFGVTSSDIVYVTLPLYHSAANVIGVGGTIRAGATLVLRRKFSASAFWKDCVEYNCTAMQYIGELCRYLVNTPPGEYDTRHHVKRAFGNGMRPDVWEIFMKRFNVPYIGEFYAATEGTTVLINNQNKVGAVGYMPPLLLKAAGFCLVKFDIVREEPVRVNGRCVECEPGEIGEFVGKLSDRDPSKQFLGYTNAAATEKKILRNAFKDGDAWYRSGDLLVADKEGFFYFKDRIGDTFRWKGENVATSEVAEVVSTFADVQEANVYGVQIPNTDGRIGMAAILLREAGKIDFAGLYTHLNSLPAYARPAFIRLLKEMDSTGTFKQRKADFVKEGYDPSIVSEELYYKNDAAKTFSRLDDAAFVAISAGKIKF